MGSERWQSDCWPSGFRRRCRHLLLAVLAALLSCGPGLVAQEPTSDSESPASPPSPKIDAGEDLPGEVSPKVYLLRDKDGKLQPVLGFSFEQFIELFKHKNQLAQQNQQPRFSIQNLTLTGSAVGTRVELTADVAVSVHDPGWVGVPLRLRDTVLTEPPKFEGPGEHFLDFEPAGDGYVFWVRAGADQEHRAKLKLVAPVAQLGPEMHLRLSIPRASLAQLNLQVPLERAVAKVPEGATLESVRAVEGGKTEFRLVGVRGECDVTWHAAKSEVAKLPTVLEATGTMSVQINGRRISTDSVLTVRSLGGEFDRFQVRLQPGADLVNAAQSGVSVVLADASNPTGKLYDVKLEKKTTGPVEIRLVTERAHDATQADDVVQLAGCEVMGAVRQGGIIAVRVEGNWQVQWGEMNHVRQLDDLAGPLGGEGLTAGFEYFAQPFTLQAKVKPQTTRIRVEPEYVVTIGSDEAQLRGRLKYTIRGAKVHALELELPGWELDKVGPESLVNADAALTAESDPRSVPLLHASSGELELTFEAHQKFAGDQTRVALDLPRPHGEVIAPANVAIVSEDHVELLVQPAEISGLASQTVRPQWKLPPKQQDPLFFRTDAAAARFVADLKVHEQAISTSVTTRLEVDDRETRVQQRINFQVSYQPSDQLLLGIPRAIRPDQISITLDGQRLIPLSPREAVGEPSDAIPMRVTLPQPRIGRCELEISYAVRYEKLSNSASTLVALPLVVPGEGQLTSNELVVVPKSGITASYPSGPWAEEARSRESSAAAELTLTARRAIPQVALALSSKEQPLESATTIERAWVQTRLTDSLRLDRVEYRLTSSEPRLVVALPAGVEMGSLELEVDGRRVSPESIRQRDVTVPLPTTIDGVHRLVVGYRFSERSAIGEQHLECAQLKSATWIRQLYWQLLMPANEHLLWSPTHFTREFHWVRSGLAWRRQATLDEHHLRNWIDPPADPEGNGDEPAATVSGSDSPAMNSYLFSTVGQVGSLEPVTISRARLVLWASLPLLLGALALIYFPSVRHPAVLLLVAAAVAMGSLIDPEPALLLAQASGLGLALALVAAVLARSSVRQEKPTISSTHGSSRAVIERSVTEMYRRAPSGSSPPSTATNPLVPTAGESES